MAEIRIHDGHLPSALPPSGARGLVDPDHWLTRGLQAFWAERPRAELRHLQHSRPQAWSRLLEHNPQARSENPPYVWLAERKEGKSFIPCGVLLGVPFLLQWGAKIQPGHWGVDLYVCPSARGLGIGRALLSRWRDLSPLALGLGITDSAFPIELSLGWQAVNIPSRWAFPLSLRGQALIQRSVSRQLLHLPALEPLPTGVRWQVFPSLPPPLQALTAQAGWIATKSHPHIRRDYAYLFWRYPSPSFQWLLLFQGEDLIGWAVIQQDMTLVRNKVWVYELWAMPEVASLNGEDGQELAAESRLVQAVLLWSRSQKADLIEARATQPTWVNVLTRRGFVSRGPSERFIVHSGSPEQQGLLAGEPWALTLGDSGNL